MNIKSVGIVGTGVIGASWASFFLARGFDVRATDPAPGAEQKLRELIASYWPTLRELGMAESASQNRLVFEKDIQRALEGVDFVQENGPERLDIKRDLIAKIDAAIPEDAIIATSSSGILISSIQDAAKHPERVLLGHPRFASGARSKDMSRTDCRPHCGKKRSGSLNKESRPLPTSTPQSRMDRDFGGDFSARS